MKRFLLIYSLLACCALGEVHTILHPGEPFDEKQTVVWSPLFQACWDRMAEKQGGKLLKVDPPNPLAMQLAGFSWKSEEVMPKGGWKVWQGPATAEFAKQVNEEAAQFGGVPIQPFHVDADMPAGEIMFGLLDRDLAFRKAFGRSKKQGMEFVAPPAEKRLVSFFGTMGRRSGEYVEDVRVLAYRPDEQCHALQVLTKQGDETVILYRPAKTQDFATACVWLREWQKQHGGKFRAAIQWNDRHLHEYDEVRVPYVTIQTETDVKERLGGLFFFENKSVPQFVFQAKQRSRFELYEKGARVRVETELGTAPFAVAETPPTPVPRQFFYDAPFFLFLWRDGADWPYFGAWIGNAEALEAFAK